MDKLKEYLKQNETGMEFDIPDGKLWQRIESDASKAPLQKSTVRMITRYIAAACILGTIATSTWFIFFDKRSSSSAIGKSEINGRRPDTVTVKTEPRPITQSNTPRLPAAPVKTAPAVIDEATMISRSYTGLINRQLNKIRSIPVYAENPRYFAVFIEQLKQMEKDEQIIKSDLNEYGLTDVLLEQFINLYQQKLNVLKSLRTEINKINNKVNQGPVHSSDIMPYYLDL